MKAVTDADLIEARALAQGLIRAFGEGVPPCWPESTRAIIRDAVRLAELAELALPQLAQGVLLGRQLLAPLKAERDAAREVIRTIGTGEN